MSGPEDVTNKNEQNESVPITPEKQEVVESVEDMQNRVLSEMTVQNEELYTEDEKIETANSAIGLSIEEVEQEKTAINLDTEIAQINSRAEQLTSESKQEINTTQEKIEKDGFYVDSRLVIKESVRVCPKCNVYSFYAEEDLFYNKYQMCKNCYIRYIEGREKK